MYTPYQVFFREIPNILIDGPMAHRHIAQRLKEQLPEHCDDLIPCSHVNDNSCHPEWDHLARSAEQGLKRKGIIAYKHATRKWELV